MTSKVIEYHISVGRTEGEFPGGDLDILEGKYWKKAQDLIGDDDVWSISRVTFWIEYDEIIDREEDDLYVRPESDIWNSNEMITHGISDDEIRRILDNRWRIQNEA